VAVAPKPPLKGWHRATFRGAIEAVNPAINAIDSSDSSAPFAGVPFVVKDLQSEIVGEPFRRGSRFYRDAVSTHDTELVMRFRKAGLIFVGKTNTPELGLTALTEPELFGPHSHALRSDSRIGWIERWVGCSSGRAWCRSPAAATAWGRCAFPRRAVACLP